MRNTKERGITLIALIITIIVLLILAGVSISMVVGDNGILSQAVNATTATDVADTKEQIEVALVGKLDDSGDYTVKDVLDVAKEITGNDVDTTNKTVETAKGNTVDLTDILAGAATSWWYDDDGNVTNGLVTLAIGDYVDYDPGEYSYTSSSSVNGYANQVFNTSSYAYSWRVLGADEDTGELLIISEAGIEPDSGGSLLTYSGITYYVLYNQLGYVNAESELNAICAIYGNGYGAIGARSLTLEDVNSLTGYDPIKNDDSIGTIWEYGNKVTYSMVDGVITYSGSNDVNGTLSNTYFLYYDELSGEWKKTLDENESVTFIQSAYYYSAEDYLNTSSVIYELLFLNANGNCAGGTLMNFQFLADRVVNVRFYCAVRRRNDNRGDGNFELLRKFFVESFGFAY